MHNPLIVGRRLAYRLAAAQAIATTVLALAFLVQGPRAAAAALYGGAAMVLGSALLAWRALAGGPVYAGIALLRLFGGIALKWLVVVSALYLALAHLELPPLPLLAGFVGAALASSLLVFRSKS